MSWLCIIRHDIPVTLHTPAAHGQRSVFDHICDKQPVVLRTRYGPWRPWYGQFEVRWLQPLHLWLSAGIIFVAPVWVSQGRDLEHVQLHPTWFEPTPECRSWLVVSNMYNGYFCGSISWSRVSLTNWSARSFPSMPHWLGMQQKRTRVLLSPNNQSSFMIWQIKQFSVSSPSIAFKEDI